MKACIGASSFDLLEKIDRPMLAPGKLLDQAHHEALFVILRGIPETICSR